MNDPDWAQERVRGFLSQASGRRPETIHSHEPLRAFDIDSLEDVEFIMEFEDEFGVEIPDPRLPIVTVGDLIDYVRAALN